MKTLSVRQPWASYIAAGWKTIEVRTWRTDHRGPLAIASSQGSDLPRGVTQIEDDATGQIIDLPRGVLLCQVELVDCRPLTPADSEAANLDPADLPDGAWAWVLRHPQPLDHRPIKGKLNLFDTPL